MIEKSAFHKYGAKRYYDDDQIIEVFESTFYVKKFAWFPIKLKCGGFVWLKPFCRKHIMSITDYITYSRIEDISTVDFLIEKIKG